MEKGGGGGCEWEERRAAQKVYMLAVSFRASTKPIHCTIDLEAAGPQTAVHRNNIALRLLLCAAPHLREAGARAEPSSK